METGVHIEGGEVHKEAVLGIAESIAIIFGAAKEANMEQGTVCEALKTLGRLGGVNGVSISDTNFSG